MVWGGVVTNVSGDPGVVDERIVRPRARASEWPDRNHDLHSVAAAFINHCFRVGPRESDVMTSSTQRMSEPKKKTGPQTQKKKELSGVG